MAKQQEVDKINDMRHYYNCKIMKHLILSPLKSLLNRRREMSDAADAHRLKQIKRHGLNKLSSAVNISLYETELKLQDKSKQAYVFNEFNLKLRGF